jgi:hypothetical protein
VLLDFLDESSGLLIHAHRARLHFGHLHVRHVRSVLMILLGLLAGPAISLLRVCAG